MRTELRAALTAVLIPMLRPVLGGFVAASKKVSDEQVAQFKNHADGLFESIDEKLKAIEQGGAAPAIAYGGAQRGHAGRGNGGNGGNRVRRLTNTTPTTEIAAARQTRSRVRKAAPRPITTVERSATSRANGDNTSLRRNNKRKCRDTARPYAEMM